ncbi:hypothetical protein MHLP_02770 [Candidatus Mycoplasma haematolamae str. Purdue]|uniref:Uncharacterized protein n=1 Tax=Mycoplasma haematolamae (strain Purdue) TaxID=1212765 RepID=I7CJT8_MYCHA|nr:hypothetical protein [Candidatus Mycoplasma haematolamae]AFO52134.1 hypothetical protein MHLP_02770 [Candidatus Mycoplasma haematolamae str. Purdue]
MCWITWSRYCLWSWRLWNVWSRFGWGGHKELKLRRYSTTTGTQVSESDQEIPYTEATVLLSDNAWSLLEKTYTNGTVVLSQSKTPENIVCIAPAHQSGNSPATYSLGASDFPGQTDLRHLRLCNSYESYANK